MQQGDEVLDFVGHVSAEQHLEHDKFWLEAKKPEVPNTLRSDPEFEFSAKVSNLLELSKLAPFQDQLQSRAITLQSKRSEGGQLRATGRHSSGGPICCYF